MAKATIPLTKELSVPDGSHILYFYSDADSYVQNVLSFIQTGIQAGHEVVLIDRATIWEAVQERMRDVLTEEQSSHVHFVENYEFYGLYGDFHFERVLGNLQSAVQPFLEQQQTVRLWGQVEWQVQPNILSKLHSYECNCDITVSDLGYVTVCAYNAIEVPAYIQQEMMKSHEFFMTDTELVRSNFYRSPSFQATVFPSISIQGQLESEMDLYRQKLDFVHVVSHEVRNPLTIIKAYSSLLQGEEQNPERQKKLRDIYDYAVVIDNEISHIISTEQMLSTESLWAKKIVLPKPLVIEVIEMMEIKARTQNIRLQHRVDLAGTETIVSNAMGFKLIVSNILNNAIKYSNEATCVHVDCTTRDGSLVMEIRDEGIGMSDEQVQRLFRKYEKMHHETTGQGIGLYMVKKLLDHFNGDVDVSSELGKGSTFQIQVPLFIGNS